LWKSQFTAEWNTTSNMKVCSCRGYVYLFVPTFRQRGCLRLNECERRDRLILTPSVTQ